MLAVTPSLLLIALSLPAQAPPTAGPLVETGTVSEDPFDTLWTPGGPGPASPAPETTADAVGPGSAPRGVAGPGAPRLQVPAPPPAQAPQMVVQTKTVRRWYRWPIVITDAIFSIMGLIGFGLENAPLAATGTLGYAFSAPAWHWSNGNMNGGILSMTMHSFGPAAVGLLSAIFGAVVQGADCNGDCGNDRAWFFGGAAAGVVATTVMDVFVLAYVDEQAPSGVSLAPVIGRAEGATTFGIGGRF